LGVTLRCGSRRSVPSRVIRAAEAHSLPSTERRRRMAPAPLAWPAPSRKTQYHLPPWRRRSVKALCSARSQSLRGGSTSSYFAAGGWPTAAPASSRASRVGRMTPGLLGVVIVSGERRGGKRGRSREGACERGGGLASYLPPTNNPSRSEEHDADAGPGGAPRPM